MPTPAPRQNPVLLSILVSALLFVTLVVVNVAASRTVVRVDLTEDRLFTLSDATRKVVGQLSDPCRILVYWGEQVPSTAEPVRRRLRGLLDEYVAAGDGHVVVQWVKMDENGTKDADEKGIPEAEFFSLEANERKVSKSHAGLVILYEDKTETIPMLVEMDEGARGYQLSSDLEYTLSSKLFKLSRKGKALVGLVSDAPAQKFDFMSRRGGGDKFTGLAQLLEDVYGNDLRRSVDLEQPVASDLAVLVLAAPKDWSEKKAFHLEQFLLRGGKVLLLANPVDAETAFGRGAEPAKTGLEDWLKAQGIELAPGVVADFDDKAQSLVALADGRVARYPYWIRLRRENLDAGNVAVRTFDGVPMYFASEVVVDAKAQEAAGRTSTTLASSTDQGYRKPDASGLNAIEGPEGKTLGKRVVAAVVQGKFTSFWKGKRSPDEPPPPEPTKTDAPPAPDAAMGETPAMADAPAMGDAAAMGDTPAMADATPPMGDAPAMAEPKSPEPAPVAPPPAPGAPPPVPGTPEAPKAPDGAKGPEGEKGDGAKKDEKPARLDEGTSLLVVFGDADLVSDDFSGVRGRDLTQGATSVNGVGGFPFVANIVDWMSGSDDLVALRARGANVRKMDEVSKDTAESIRIANLAAIPLLALILGLVVYFVRKHRS